MTVAGTIMLVWVAVIGLSLLGIAVFFVLGAGSGARTVSTAARRARTRPAAFGELAAHFAPGTLVQLDETLERVWLDEMRHGADHP